jgi:putative oxidoreductase
MAHGRLTDANGGRAVKTLTLILRLIVGCVFLASAVFKIWNVEIKPGRGIRASTVPDLAAFAKDVTNYRVPPRELNNLVAITLPWIELLAGGMLVAGVWKRASAATITLLLVVFLLAIAQALARGLNINCGCFGSVEARKVGLLALVQETALLAMAGWLWWRETD